MRKDVIIGDDYQLNVQNGDFEVRQSDMQHLHFIIKSHPTQWNQFPLLGYGEYSFLNAIFDGIEKRKVRLQCESDGYRLI